MASNLRQRMEHDDCSDSDGNNFGFDFKTFTYASRGPYHSVPVDSYHTYLTSQSDAGHLTSSHLLFTSDACSISKSAHNIGTVHVCVPQLVPVSSTSIFCLPKVDTDVSGRKIVSHAHHARGETEVSRQNVNDKDKLVSVYQKCTSLPQMNSDHASISDSEPRPVSGASGNERECEDDCGKSHRMSCVSAEDDFNEKQSWWVCELLNIKQSSQDSGTDIVPGDLSSSLSNQSSRSVNCLEPREHGASFSQQFWKEYVNNALVAKLLTPKSSECLPAHAEVFKDICPDRGDFTEEDIAFAFSGDETMDKLKLQVNYFKRVISKMKLPRNLPDHSSAKMEPCLDVSGSAEVGSTVSISVRSKNVDRMVRKEEFENTKARDFYRRTSGRRSASVDASRSSSGKEKYSRTPHSYQNSETAVGNFSGRSTFLLVEQCQSKFSCQTGLFRTRRRIFGPPVRQHRSQTFQKTSKNVRGERPSERQARAKWRVRRNGFDRRQQCIVFAQRNRRREIQVMRRLRAPTTNSLEHKKTTIAAVFDKCQDHTSSSHCKQCESKRCPEYSWGASKLHAMKNKATATSGRDGLHARVHLRGRTDIKSTVVQKFNPSQSRHHRKRSERGKRIAQTYRRSSPNTQACRKYSPNSQAYRGSSPNSQAYRISSPNTQAYRISSPNTQAYRRSSPNTQAYRISSPNTQAYRISSPNTQAYRRYSPNTQAYRRYSPNTQAYRRYSPNTQTYRRYSPNTQAYRRPTPITFDNDGRSEAKMAGTTLHYLDPRAKLVRQSNNDSRSLKAKDNLNQHLTMHNIGRRDQKKPVASTPRESILQNVRDTVCSREGILAKDSVTLSPNSCGQDALNRMEPPISKKSPVDERNSFSQKTTKRELMDFLGELCHDYRPLSPVPAERESFHCFEDASRKYLPSVQSKDAGVAQSRNCSAGACHVQPLKASSLSVPCAGAIQYEVGGITVTQLFGTSRNPDMRPQFAACTQISNKSGAGVELCECESVDQEDKMTECVVLSKSNAIIQPRRQQKQRENTFEMKEIKCSSRGSSKPSQPCSLVETCFYCGKKYPLMTARVSSKHATRSVTDANSFNEKKIVKNEMNLENDRQQMCSKFYLKPARISSALGERKLGTTSTSAEECHNRICRDNTTTYTGSHSLKVDNINNNTRTYKGPHLLNVDNINYNHGCEVGLRCSTRAPEYPHRPEAQNEVEGHRPEAQNEVESHKPEAQNEVESHKPKAQNEVEGHRPEAQNEVEGHQPEVQNEVEGEEMFICDDISSPIVLNASDRVYHVSVESSQRDEHSHVKRSLNLRTITQWRQVVHAIEAGKYEKDKNKDKWMEQERTNGLSEEYTTSVADPEMDVLTLAMKSAGLTNDFLEQFFVSDVLLENFLCSNAVGTEHFFDDGENFIDSLFPEDEEQENFVDQGSMLESNDPFSKIVMSTQSSSNQPRCSRTFNLSSSLAEESDAVQFPFQDFQAITEELTDANPANSMPTPTLMPCSSHRYHLKAGQTSTLLFYEDGQLSQIPVDTYGLQCQDDDSCTQLLCGLSSEVDRENLYFQDKIRHTSNDGPTFSEDPDQMDEALALLPPLPPDEFSSNVEAEAEMERSSQATSSQRTEDEIKLLGQREKYAPNYLKNCQMEFSPQREEFGHDIGRRRRELIKKCQYGQITTPDDGMRIRTRKAMERKSKECSSHCSAVSKPPLSDSRDFIFTARTLIFHQEGAENPEEANFEIKTGSCKRKRKKRHDVKEAMKCVEFHGKLKEADSERDNAASRGRTRQRGNNFAAFNGKSSAIPTQTRDSSAIHKKSLSKGVKCKKSAHKNTAAHVSKHGQNMDVEIANRFTRQLEHYCPRLLARSRTTDPCRVQPRKLQTPLIVRKTYQGALRSALKNSKAQQSCRCRCLTMDSNNNADDAKKTPKKTRELSCAYIGMENTRAEGTEESEATIKRRLKQLHTKLTMEYASQSHNESLVAKLSVASHETPLLAQSLAKAKRSRCEGETSSPLALSKDKCHPARRSGGETGIDRGRLGVLNFVSRLHTRYGEHFARAHNISKDTLNAMCFKYLDYQGVRPEEAFKPQDETRIAKADKEEKPTRHPNSRDTTEICNSNTQFKTETRIGVDAKSLSNGKKEGKKSGKNKKEEDLQPPGGDRSINNNKAAFTFKYAENIIKAPPLTRISPLPSETKKSDECDSLKKEIGNGLPPVGPPTSSKGKNVNVHRRQRRVIQSKVDKSLNFKNWISSRVEEEEKGVEEKIRLRTSLACPYSRKLSGIFSGDKKCKTGVDPISDQEPLKVGSVQADSLSCSDNEAKAFASNEEDELDGEFRSLSNRSEKAQTLFGPLNLLTGNETKHSEDDKEAKSSDDITREKGTKRTEGIASDKGTKRTEGIASDKGAKSSDDITSGKGTKRSEGIADTFLHENMETQARPFSCSVSGNRKTNINKIVSYDKTDVSLVSFPRREEISGSRASSGADTTTSHGDVSLSQNSTTELSRTSLNTAAHDSVNYVLSGLQEKCLEYQSCAGRTLESEDCSEYQSCSARTLESEDCSESLDLESVVSLTELKQMVHKTAFPEWMEEMDEFLDVDTNELGISSVKVPSRDITAADDEWEFRGCAQESDKRNWNGYDQDINAILEDEFWETGSFSCRQKHQRDRISGKRKLLQQFTPDPDLLTDHTYSAESTTVRPTVCTGRTEDDDDNDDDDDKEFWDLGLHLCDSDPAKHSKMFQGNNGLEKKVSGSGDDSVLNLHPQPEGGILSRVLSYQRSQQCSKKPETGHSFSTLSVNSFSTLSVKHTISEETQDDIARHFSRNSNFCLGGITPERCPLTTSVSNRTESNHSDPSFKCSECLMPAAPDSEVAILKGEKESLGHEKKEFDFENDLDRYELESLASLKRVVTRSFDEAFADFPFIGPGINSRTSHVTSPTLAVKEWNIMSKVDLNGISNERRAVPGNRNDELGINRNSNVRVRLTGNSSFKTSAEGEKQ